MLTFAQSSMSPTIMNRSGAFQIFADLFKILTQEIFLMPRSTTMMAPISPPLLSTPQLLFSLNFVWGLSMFLFDPVDLMILYPLMLMLFSNIFFSMVGLLSHFRYAMMATMSGLVYVISLDIFVTVLYSVLILSSQSANLHDFTLVQVRYWYLLLYAPAASLFVVVLFLLCYWV